MADSTGKVQKILEVKLNANPAIMGIMELNKQIEENRKSMQKMAEATGKNTDSYVKLEQQTKALTAEKRVLQKEVQNEYKVQTEQLGSMKQMEAELRVLKKEYKELGEEERRTGQRGIELRDQINKTTTELKKAEYGIQEYYRNVGNYQNAILNAIGLNGRFGTSIMNIVNVQGGVQGAFTAMGNSVKAFGSTLLGLLSNPVFLAIAGIVGVGMAFKWWYDYNEGLVEASRLTEQFTGLQGEQMQGFRDKVMATADVMGHDFKETLQAADAVMANFHVDGEQAMDAINKGFAAGADVNGDFLSKVQQYAPAFHDAGISAEQMVAIISQTKSGIFTDQGLDAIKMGSTRIREMSNTTKQALQSIGVDTDAMQAKMREGTMGTFEALQQVSTQLKTLPDNAQEVGEVMSAVFGRQGKFAAQEMIEGLADMSTSLDEVTAQTGEYGELLLENIDTEEELNNVTAALFDLTDNGWENIKQQATIYAKKALVAVVKGLIDVANWFIRLYNNSLPVRAAVQSIATQFKILWSVVKWAFNNIINGFKTIGRGISAVVNGFNQAGNAIKAFGKGVALIFKGISKMSWEMIEQGWNTISSGIKSAAISAFDGLKEVVTAGAEDWSKAATTLGNEVGTALMDGIKNTMSDQWNEIKIPAFDGGGGVSTNTNGGGGGSGSNNTNTNGGGSGSRNRRGGRNSGRNSGRTSNRGTGSRGSHGGASRGSTKREKTDAEKAEEEYQKRIDDLIKKGTELERKALEERAKTEKDAVEKLAKEQRDLLTKMYGGKEYLQKRLSAASTDADKKRWEDAIKYYDQALAEIDRAEQEGYKNIEENAKKADEERKKRAAAVAKQITQIYLDTSKEGSEERLIFQKELLDQEEEAELAAVEDSEELRNAIVLKYQQKREQLEKEHQQKQLQAVQTYAEMMLASTEEHDKANLEWRLKSLKQQMELEMLQYEDNEEMKAAIRAKYQQLELQAHREHTQAVIAFEQEKYNAVATITNGMSQVMNEFGDDNKEAVALSKMLALAEIMINQAVAISNAVKAGSNAVSPWQMIAQIATSVTAVTVAMAQAFKSLNEAKFATGGYVRGAGTGTSDSIPVRVSNGESIMNANTTAMFSGLLSSLNQLGGGVPIQAQQTASSVRGEDMLARAVARGVAMLPAPVVSVEDINRGQRQVEVMNERATL